MVDQTGPAEKVSLIGSWQGPVVYRCHQLINLAKGSARVINRRVMSVAAAAESEL